MSKKKSFVVTVEYQGEEDVFSGDITILLSQYKYFEHLKEIYGDIVEFEVEDLDSQEV